MDKNGSISCLYTIHRDLKKQIEERDNIVNKIMQLADVKGELNSPAVSVLINGIKGNKQEIKEINDLIEKAMLLMEMTCVDDLSFDAEKYFSSIEKKS